MRDIMTDGEELPPAVHRELKARAHQALALDVRSEENVR